MYTPEEREGVRTELIAAARSDPRIAGAALTGSGSVGREDRWSDIDAADQDIDNKLRRNPQKHSQLVSEELRRIISDPLVVYFTIEGNQVVVEAVGWIER